MISDRVSFTMEDEHGRRTKEGSENLSGELVWE
jgi:hypothetical protein